MKQRSIAFVILLSMIIAFCPVSIQVMSQEAVQADRTFSPVTDDSAYIIFENKIRSSGMSFVDGQTEGITDRENILYNRSVNIGGYEARYYLPENRLHIRLGPGFAAKGDNEFLMIVHYYDYGPDWDTINIEYNSSDSSLSDEMKIQKVLMIKKPGGKGEWRSEAFYIKDAAFAGKLPYNSDIRITTRRENAFGMIELVNISKARRESGSFIPNLTTNKIDICKELGIYDAGLSENRQYETITREEAVAAILTAAGYRKSVSEFTGGTGYTDVSEQYVPWIGFSEKCGFLQRGNGTPLRAKEAITRREVLEIYWRILGYDGSQARGDGAEQTALDVKLLESTDFVFRLDYPINRSQLASIALNALSVTDKDTGYPLLIKLVNNGDIKREQIRSTNNVLLNRALDQVPYYLPCKRVVDPETGRMINVLVFEAGWAVRVYMTNQQFTSDGKRFIVGNDLTKGIYEYNMETQMVRWLDYCDVAKLANAVVQPDDVMYYIRNMEIWKMDLNTYEKKKLADVPQGVNLTLPTVSNDGKYFSGNFMRSAEPEDFWPSGRVRGHIAPRLDLETGEWDLSLDYIFPLEPTHLCHSMINPVYTDLVLFCHEGSSDLLDDRVWVGDFSTGEMKNVYKQAYSRDGLMWEPAGHEMWTEDGEEILFTSGWRRLEQRVGMGGIIRCKKDGTEREYISNEYHYNHSFISADKNWTIADTFTDNGSRQEVVLVDNRTYEATLVVSKFEYAGVNHPHHAHPDISRDNKFISWAHAYRYPDGKLTLGCGWMDVSDLTDKEMVGGRAEISNEFTKYSYIGTETETEKTVLKGEDCFYTPKNCSFYLDLNNDILFDGKATKTFRITYLDSGYLPVSIRYTSEWVTSSDYTKREDKRLNLPRKNSGRWVTKEFTLTDASFLNIGKHRSDFAITGGVSDLYVKSIELVK